MCVCVCVCVHHASLSILCTLYMCTLHQPLAWAGNITFIDPNMEIGLGTYQAMYIRDAHVPAIVLHFEMHVSLHLKYTAVATCTKVYMYVIFNNNIKCHVMVSEVLSNLSHQSNEL